MEPFDLTKQPTTSGKEGDSRELMLRIMTYNIHSCIDSNRNVNPVRIAEIIRGLNADVVALQEVDAQTPLSPKRNQAALLAEMLEMYQTFFPVEHTGLHAFGLAILSCFAFTESHQSFLPNLYPRLNPRKRGAIRARIQTPVGPIHIINTHLSLFKLERQKQLKTLMGKDWLLAVPKNEPVIFCGDLNAGPSSETYHTLSLYLTDVQKNLRHARPPASQPTFHSKSPLFHIDHIFVSRHSRALHVAVINTPDTQTASDHLPLLADLEIFFDR